MAKRSIDERFWAKVDEASGPLGCREWTAYKTKQGYGLFSYEGRLQGAHRVSWILAYGEIPEGMTVDHYICDNSSCVELTHLKLATLRDNILRSGTSPGAVNARKTHCKREHPLSGDNLYVQPDGRRICKTCKRESQQTSEVRARKARWARENYTKVVAQMGD